MKDELTRRELSVKGDGWTYSITFDTETQAKQELAWLKSHGTYREYMLVAITDKLDDEIPF